MKDRTYEIEKLFLSQFASFSNKTIGRDVFEEPCPLRTEYQRDRDRIIHSKAFRRLKNKTQVFLAPTGDHYRTRMTHTLDVCQIARSISRALSLNEDLTEAIALGHDLGHTPFGHTGERTLASLTDGYFHHNQQSLRVVEVLEKDGLGLNLTKEVRDGILNHRTSGKPTSLEGKVVMFADKIAYINHDIDDSVRAGLITEKDLPSECTLILGKTATERINTLIMAIYNESFGKPFVDMTANIKNAMDITRSWLFDNVYTEKGGNREGEKADNLLRYLYSYYSNNPNHMNAFFNSLLDKYPLYMVVCDYLASMSDTYAIDNFSNLFLPKRWEVL